MIKTSIIVPTRSRSKYLAIALKSLLSQNYPSSHYEIIIVDNGSIDNTRKIAQTFKENNPAHNIKYIFEPEPGLLSGRHRGALNAKGEILIFIDDDIEAVSGWLTAIINIYYDNSVHLVGGPSFPKFEVTPPEWIASYFKFSQDTFRCSFLSLIYLGNKIIEIDPRFVWGLNFSIRKKTLFDLGGFHPDALPREYIQFRGDGETGLAEKLKKERLKSIYTPQATVYHYIPKERLTVKYFENRYYSQGISDSYNQIRNNSGEKIINIPSTKHIKNLTSTSAYDQYKQIIHQRINKSYVDGFLFHQKSIKSNEHLLKWVTKDNYFDYRFQKISSNRDYDIEKAMNLSTAVIYITELCNSRCITCNSWKNINEKKLDTNTWFSILKQIRGIGISTLELVGGEPLLRDDILKIIYEAKNLGFSNIIVSSNGFLLNKAILDRLIESGVNSFHISLDGIDKTYKFIRGVDWYNRILSNLRMISQHKVNLLILTTLVRQNIMELKEIVNLAQELGAKWFPNILENRKYLFKNINMNPIQIDNIQDIQKTISILEYLVQKYSKTCIIGNDDIHYINDYLIDQKCEKAIPCKVGLKSIYLDPKANVYTSCMSMPPAGNILSTPLNIIIQSTPMYNNIDSMIRRKCSGCTCDYSQRSKLYYNYKMMKFKKL